MSFVASINTTLSKARELKRTFYVIVAKAIKFLFTALTHLFVSLNKIAFYGLLLVTVR